jgi:hypothetical protein
MAADIGRLIGVHLSQHHEVGVARVHAQHARERRVERMVGPGLVGDAAALCSLPKALEGSLGLPLRLRVHAGPEVSRNPLSDGVQERDLDDRVDARQVGAVLLGQPDGGIDATRAGFAVIEMHKQVLVRHQSLRSSPEDSDRRRGEAAACDYCCFFPDARIDPSQCTARFGISELCNCR